MIQAAYIETEENVSLCKSVCLAAYSSTIIALNCLCIITGRGSGRARVQAHY